MDTSFYYTVVGSGDSISWLDKLFPNSISALLGVIVGGFITYTVNRMLKDREVKTVSRNSATYVDLILQEQCASARLINEKLEETQGSGGIGVWLASPLPVGIKQDAIEKILGYAGFYKSQYENVIHSITISELSYRKCFKAVERYNQFLEKYASKYSTPKELEDDLKNNQIFLKEREDRLNLIQEAYLDFAKINDKAIKDFYALCKEVFGKEYMNDKTTHG